MLKINDKNDNASNFVASGMVPMAIPRRAISVAWIINKAINTHVDCFSICFDLPNKMWP